MVGRGSDYRTHPALRLRRRVAVLAGIRLIATARFEHEFLPGSLRRLGLICLLVVAYGLAIPRIGIWPATALFTAGCLWVEGERRPIIIFGVPIGLALLGFLLIELLLNVYLPPGIWFEGLLEAGS